MARSPSLEWLFLDLNGYFASVEQQVNPALRGRPVAVVPVLTDSSCAIATSYEAKAFGVTTGTRIFEAKQRCPDITLVPAHHDLYVDYHHRILAELACHLPIAKVHSIDEAACRLLGTERERDKACALANAIKRGIWKNVGEHLHCSIGLAPTSFLAKIATELEKPNGLVTLEAEELPGPLFRLALRDLPGIGANIERRLGQAGIASVSALWHLEPKHARRIWGGVAGERFWYALHGTEIPERHSARRSVGHSHVLGPELRPPAQARGVARRLLVKAASRLRRLDLTAARVGLGVSLTNGRRWKGTCRVARAEDNFTFLGGVDRLWGNMLAEAGAFPVRKISVLLLDLLARSAVQPDLFEVRSGPEHRLRQRREKLSAAMDQLNRRYGRDTVAFGALPAPKANFTGTKIAFTRIPELAEFHE